MGFSQKNEDDIILQHVGPIGCFLDVGAFDGVNYSNTMALVERGWYGFMVEPGLDAFQALLKNHGGNKNLTLVHAAVGDGRITQFWHNSRTFSTTLESNRDRFLCEGFGEPFWVPTITWDQLLGMKPGIINVLSIDTEGTSVDLFKSFPFASYQPKVVCVEHDGRVDECQEFARSVGYHGIMQNEENLIFGR